jgi:hypothetical protein
VLAEGTTVEARYGQAAGFLQGDAPLLVVVSTGGRSENSHRGAHFGSAADVDRITGNVG